MPSGRIACKNGFSWLTGCGATGLYGGVALAGICRSEGSPAPERHLRQGLEVGFDSLESGRHPLDGKAHA